MEENFNEGNIVWIKLKGYPWWPGIIKKFLSSQECLVKFFIELSESKINISKLRPFDKYKEEFSKTKLKKLKNIIKIAEIVSKGEMTFEQHTKFVKGGKRLFEEQYNELEKIKREKKKIEEKKREKIREKEKLNHTKNSKKFKTIKKMKLLGKKRKIYDSRNNYNCNMTKELICSIDEFIFHKREVKLINGYDSFFDNMKKKISESLLNTNGLNAILKLYKYMNNPRNFSPDASNKSSFLSLKKEINKKIKETLFDDNCLFYSSSFNFFCSNYNSSELTQEGINLSNLIDNLPLLNKEEASEDDLNIKKVKENEKIKSNKKLSDSEDDKSSSVISKQTKSTQNDESKNKLNIGILKFSDLSTLLKINENNDLNEKLYEPDEEKIREIIDNIEKELKNENGEKDIKNDCLRKNVCLKLYKAFHFGLKKLKLDDNEIKDICLYIEKQGRIIDNSMTNKYKEFIENVLKKISTEKIMSN